MPLRLSFDTGALAGIHIVTAAKSIRLGRDPAQNDILLTNPKVSRKHALLEKSIRGGYSIEIVGNGPTKLNGDNVVPVAGRPTVQALNSGDHVELGGVEFTVAEAEIRLICTTGAAAGKEVLLNGPASIGSGGDCDLVIAEPGVAALHLEITSTPLGLKADAHARTSFNGAPADSRMLAHGDEIVIGTATLRVNVTVAGEADDESTTIGSTNAATIIVSKDLSAVGELVFIAGSSKGEKIPLGDNQIIIGTRDDCTCRVNDLLASPVHCAISKSGEEFIATDLGSETGTYINGERIFKGVALKPGDLIAVGSSVLESRMLGGVKLEKRGLTTFTMMGDLSKMGPQPRFVLDGRVISAKKIILGRAPTCDVIVDGATCSREHCAIEYSSTTSSFNVRDTSAHGTYLDDKRVVKQPLTASCVLRVGDTLFRVTVRGEVCTMERADAALAEAAVEVARQQASEMTRAFNQQGGAPPNFGQAGPGGPNPGGPMAGGMAMKTMFHMNVGQLEQQIQVRKKDLKKNAPAWRPSSDLKRDGALRGAIVLALVAGLGLCGVVTLFGGGQSLVNHPLSAAHSSAAFTDKSSGATPCSACHSAGARVELARCQTCHTDFKPRASHVAKASLDCQSCHKEHTGAAQYTALGAYTTCGASGCHTAQHAKEFATTAAEPKSAGPIPKGIDIVALARDWAKDKTIPAIGLPKPGSAAARLISLHQGHAAASVGCTGCHGDASGGADKMVKFDRPQLACFRCHDGGKDPKAIDCGGCHGGEHPQSKPHPAAAPTASVSSVTPVTSLAWAGGLAFIGGLPVMLFGFFIRVRRGRTTDKMMKDLKSHPAEVVKRLVHSMNDSKCVGCGMCVQACPASVLELVDHKSRVVNFDACIQCKRCENSCAFDALRMHDADKPPPMIPMPSIDAFHETPVPGLFLVGQASGTPQVKNATNLGRAAVQRIVQRGYGPGAGRQLGCEIDIIIVGSGPSGLSAALTCIELGLSYVVLEKEREFSWTIRNYYHKGKEVMAEPNDVALEATLPHWDSKREELLGAWKELIDNNKMEIRFQTSVIDVKKDGEKFNVQLADGKGTPTNVITAGRVILAIGTLGNPRKLGCPGDDLEKVKNSLVDPDEWSGKNILVVGGSDSAVEVVLALCVPTRNNKVTFSTRGAKLEGIKPKNRKLIEDALNAKQFEIKYRDVGLERQRDGRVVDVQGRRPRRDDPVRCHLRHGRRQLAAEVAAGHRHPIRREAAQLVAAPHRLALAEDGRRPPRHPPPPAPRDPADQAASLTVPALRASVFLGVCGALVVSSIACGPRAVPPPPSAHVGLAIHDVRVFDGVHASEHRTVLVAGDHIVAVGAAADLAVPAGATVIEGAGGTLLPGLIDAHAHVNDEAEPRAALDFGVTTEIDMYSSPEVSAALAKQDAAGGVLDRARVVPAGFGATAPGGHGTEYGSPVPTLSTPAQAEPFVAERAAEGSHHLKIILETGVELGIPFQSLDEATVRALVGSAHARKMLAVAHVGSAADVTEALAAGVDGLAHLPVQALDAATIAAIAAQHVFVVPTLTVNASICGGHPGDALLADARIASAVFPDDAQSLAGAFPALPDAPRSCDAPALATRALRDAGVRILAGTDAGNPGTAHGASVHDELARLVAAGLTPTEALAAATSAPVAAFGLPHLGVIEPGALADLLLVDGDPTRDITQTRAIRGVWRSGHALDVPARRAAATAARDAARAASASHLGPLADFDRDDAATARFSAISDRIQGGTSTSKIEVITAASGAGTGGSGSGATGRVLSVSGTVVAPAGELAWAGATAFLGDRATMSPVDLSAAKKLRFWVRGQEGNYTLFVFTGTRRPSTASFAVTTAWAEVTIDLTTLGPRNAVIALTWAATAPGPFAFQLDRVSLD